MKPYAGIHAHFIARLFAGDAGVVMMPDVRGYQWYILQVLLKWNQLLLLFSNSSVC
ncbi:MAG: hypothetical protein ACLPZR_15680 [Solirubrobacteraceae bacterium]